MYFYNARIEYVIKVKLIRGAETVTTLLPMSWTAGVSTELYLHSSVPFFGVVFWHLGILILIYK